MSNSKVPDSAVVEAESTERHVVSAKRRLVTTIGAALIAVTAIGLVFCMGGADEVFTDDAYVHGNQIQLAARVAGTVVAIHADNTDRVERGQVLIELDDTDATLALEAAEANLAATAREVRQLFDGAAAIAAEVRQRQVELAQRQHDFERRAGTKPGSISHEEYEHARSAFEAAKAALTAARERLAASRAQTSNTTEAAHPRVLRAKTVFRDAYINLRRTKVLAPVDGYVVRRSVQIGQRVDLATSMLTIVPLEQVWVEANFKEVQLADVRIGQPARITADFYGDDVVYDGRILGLAAGTGSAFALLPPQNATGNWVKIVQRVPVRIELDPTQLAKHPLRLGLSMQVSVATHDRTGRTLASSAERRPLYETSVYSSNLQGAERRIEQILQANLAPRVHM
jgi:membrane fusion protein (multidrug efflux system)